MARRITTNWDAFETRHPKARKNNNYHKKEDGWDNSKAALTTHDEQADIIKRLIAKREAAKIAASTLS